MKKLILKPATTYYLDIIDDDTNTITGKISRAKQTGFFFIESKGLGNDFVDIGEGLRRLFGADVVYKFSHEPVNTHGDYSARGYRASEHIKWSINDLSRVDAEKLFVDLMNDAEKEKYKFIHLTHNARFAEWEGAHENLGTNTLALTIKYWMSETGIYESVRDGY